MSVYKIILVEFPEVSLNDHVVDYAGWEWVSTIISEYLLRHNISRINWRSTSARKDLSTEFIEDFQDNLDWEVFLLCETPKDINFLVRNKKRIDENKQVFDDERVKKNYYNNPEFIDAFSEYIDWVWYGINVKIPEYLLDRYWPLFNPSILSASQNLTPALYEKYWEFLDWGKISRYQKLNETLINKWACLLHWKEIFSYQKLSQEILERYKFNCPCSNKIIPSHQHLSEKFIENNIKWLDIPSVCEKQNMSYDFLRKYKKIWVAESLEKNVFYNRPNTIQILKNPKTKVYYILNSPNHKRSSYFTIP